METGSISRKIDRGKHTTRHSELLVLEEDEKVEDCGSYIVDTPDLVPFMSMILKKNN